jgi:hypothetical protein
MGTSKPCPGCGRECEIQPSRLARDLVDRVTQAKEQHARQWAHHDHVSEPRPLEDPNGFLGAVRAYGREHGLRLASLLAGAGFFGYPATEYSRKTLDTLRTLAAEARASEPMAPRWTGDSSRPRPGSRP